MYKSLTLYTRCLLKNYNDKHLLLTACLRTFYTIEVRYLWEKRSFVYSGLSEVYLFLKLLHSLMST